MSHHGARALWVALTIGGAAGCLADPDAGPVADPAGDGLATAASAEQPAAALDSRCAADNGGIRLPAGFCASVFADTVGVARQIAVTKDGEVYVAIGPTHDGSDPGHVLALKDDDDDGVADRRMVFGTIGGNGVEWLGGWLYLAANDRILRYSAPSGTLGPVGNATVIVQNLPALGDHPAKSVVRIGDLLYVNHGSASNACQRQNRVRHSPGIDPCPELEKRAGIWVFSAIKPNQILADGRRFATGLRNSNALQVDRRTNTLWAVPNGRDQLFDNWPELYTEEDDRVLPSEEIIWVRDGGDYGWPYCYHDPIQAEMVLAPEYGGDGTTTGRCDDVRGPLLNLPAHSAPLSIEFYTGAMFPERYKHGMFVATHGSRFEPESIDPPGYDVQFVSFENGLPVDREPFATGFAGALRPLPLMAEHRPVGLATMPDGSLLISDDKRGRIWRVFYATP